MDLRETGWEVVDLMHLVQDRDLLWIWWWTFGCYKRRGISWLSGW